jgi:uracil-DNA glycosylase family 4
LNRRTLIIEAMGLGPVWQARTPEEQPQAEAHTAWGLEQTIVQQIPSAAPTEAPHHAMTAHKPGPGPAPAPALQAEPELVQEIPPQEAPKPADITTQPQTAPVVACTLDELAKSVHHCERCRLCKTRSQTVFGRGNTQARWLLIGEAPGEQEDRQGEPFVGRAGHLLDNMLAATHLSCEQDVYIANVLKCRPPSNRNPAGDEIAACQDYLRQQIALIKPEVILALGRFAAQTLLNSELSISRLRGKVHQYQGTPLIVSYHPAYLLRNPSDKARAWEDLQLAKKILAPSS